MKKILSIIILSTIIPTTLFAADLETGSFSELATSIYNIIKNIIIPLIIAAGIAIFFYRIVISIYKVGDDPKAVKDSKWLLIWGIVALFVMVSLWGIIGFFSNSLGFTPIVPQLGR